MSSPPAAAEALVVHVEALCEQEDHLWDVIGQLSVPSELLTDDRDQSKTQFKTEELTRAFLYQHVRGFSQNELAERLQERTTLLHRFGFGVDDRDHAPEQQTLSYAWSRFGESRETIRATARAIQTLAVEHDIISEALTATNSASESAETPESSKEIKKEKATQTVRLARKHVLPEFVTGRAAHQTYSDEEILEMFARMCATRGSAHSESEYGWLMGHDLTCHNSTFLRAIKKVGTTKSGSRQSTLSDFHGSDTMPGIELIRDQVMGCFDAATENVINSIRGEDPFNSRETVAAIDITHVPFHVWPWEDREADIAKPDYPPMVSGYKKDEEYKRGYKFATITLVGDQAPIVLGIEPVKENSSWESGDAPSTSKAELVSRLLDSAEQFVDLDTVLFDRGFYVHDVYAEVDDRGLTYLSPVPKYEDDLEAIEGIQEHPTAEQAVEHNVPFGVDGEVHHRAEFLYAPSTRDDASGKYAVFVTNKNRVEPEEISSVVNGYSRRWDIENQYKSVVLTLASIPPDGEGLEPRFCRRWLHVAERI
ncbi:transposase [Halobaculum magnesiiphilum]|uniref:Transposase n=1 Tax=Halobaculum magnesiiphilum TaxID=1017351 RepID=A0A8T8W9R0_9EURY|nr:transposase [Halobaculum magnesiiphilum]